MDGGTVAVAVEACADFGDQFALPGVGDEAVFGPGGFDFPQFGGGRGIEFAIDALLAQFPPAADETAGGFVDGEIDLQPGGGSIGADQGVAVNRIGEHLRPGGGEVDVGVEQGLVVL